MTKDVLKITVEGLGEVIGTAIARATGERVSTQPVAAAPPPPAPSPAAAPASAAVEPEAAITKEVFRAKLSQFANTEENRAKVVAAIGKYGALKVPEVPVDKYAAVLADLGL